MKIYLLDDDNFIIRILKQIVEQRSLGSVCGFSTDPEEGLEDIKYIHPDIVLCDLLMPGMDGIEVVERARRENRDCMYVMLSQVSDKEMVSQAYAAGVEFFIQKPINSIEVENVVKNVAQKLSLQRTMDQMHDLFRNNLAVQEDIPEAATGRTPRYQERLQEIMRKLGIVGLNGCRDISNIVDHYIDKEDEFEAATMKEILAHFTDSPKAMEQRIRRTAGAGMTNLAHLGNDDYNNPIFEEYASFLYNFDQVRLEMEFLQGRSEKSGNLKVKQFLSALMVACNRN